MKGDHDDIPYQKKGFFVSWLRQNAYICQTNFPCLDLVIPMAFRLREHDDDTVDPDCMSGIFISVKNRSGTEDFGEDFLSREAVEGVLSDKKRKADEESEAEKKAFKADDGARRVRQEREIDAKYDEGKGGNDAKGDEGKSGTDAKETAEPKICACNKNLNVRLTLHSLKFLNPAGIPDGGSSSHDSWIASSEDKPFIAFAMSMGMTDRKEDLFIGEENVNFFLDSTNLFEERV